VVDEEVWNSIPMVAHGVEVEHIAYEQCWDMRLAHHRFKEVASFVRRRHRLLRRMRVKIVRW
jgi:hypothetical protein